MLAASRVAQSSSPLGPPALVRAIQNMPAEGAKRFSAASEGFRETFGSCRAFQRAAERSRDLTSLAKRGLSLKPAAPRFLRERNLPAAQLEGHYDHHKSGACLGEA